MTSVAGTLGGGGVSEAEGIKQNKKGRIVKVGFYEVERTVGKGNYAVVKLGRHKITKTEVSSLANT